MDSTPPQPKRVFVSYAHKDRIWYNEFEEHMAPFAAGGMIDAWDDSKIQTGEQWKAEIIQALEAADIGVMLVTPAFLASKFIREIELPAILKKKVFWIAVRPSSYRITALEGIQCANVPDKALALLIKAKRDEVWVAILDKLNRMSNPAPANP